jgi:pimeloyl-ACP methyl ester carboxylesterase
MWAAHRPPRRLAVPISPAALIALVLLTPEPAIETRLVQVAPPVPFWATPRKTSRTGRAVVLIHGLRPHPLSETSVWEPELSAWEEPSSPLVKTLTLDADVYSLAYGQNASVDDVARVRSLGRHITRLRAAGYSEIVLVGYSAGALIARYYVENSGGGGVTKVIQVCPPNGGSGWSKLAGGVRKSQEVFVRSLAKDARQAVMRARADLPVPPDVEFVCLVGSFGPSGDGLVRYHNQWPPDLQRQGIPAVLLPVPHLTAMHSKLVAQTLADLVRRPQPRWSPAQVEAARARILREKE